MTATNTPPANAKVFEHVSIMPGTAAQLFEFHAAPGAFSRLTPPPIFVQMHRNALRTLTDGEVEFTLWFGPLPVRWHARHSPGANATSFIDQMVSGPVAYWYHEHLMTDTPQGAELRDRITIAHKPGLAGLLSRLMFDGLPLRVLFLYRHLRTRMALQSLRNSG
jgi:ligand-binding SRPBCC domain-containing protein